MAATADLILLPVIPPVRLPIRQRQSRYRYPDTRLAPNRIYRERRTPSQAILSYSASGLVMIDPRKGRKIDVYA